MSNDCILHDAEGKSPDTVRAAGTIGSVPKCLMTWGDRFYKVLASGGRLGSTPGNCDQAAPGIGAGTAVLRRRRRGFFRGAFHAAGTTRRPNNSSSDHTGPVSPAAIAGVRPNHFRPAPVGASTRKLSCSQQKL